jgi:hypothetical protein
MLTNNEDFDAILAVETASEPTHELPDVSALHFILAGKARFTVVSPKTGNRFTYKVSRKEVDGGKVLHFVKVLTGQDNDSDYTFLGTIFDGREYRRSFKSSIGPQAPSAVAFAWLVSRLVAGKDLAGVSVHHEGRCGRCGRTLTVPSSIETGFGPECAGK